MNVFHSRGTWIAPAIMGAAIISAIGAALLLDAVLPDSGRARNIFSVIQSFVAAVAIVGGSFLAYQRFHVFRTLYPHLTIRHTVFYRRLSESYIHMDVTAILHNSSKVHIELRRCFAIVQDVAPRSDSEAETLYEESLDDKQGSRFQWPTIVRTDRRWVENELIIEPGGQHSETFEFVIEGWEKQAVLLYTYFYNERSGQDAGAGDGWAATTVYDIGE